MVLNGLALNHCGIVESEINEFKQAVKSGDKDKMEDELGDVLFSVVNLARWHKLDAEIALNRANEKFKNRFQLMEKMAEKDLSLYSIEELEKFMAKRQKRIKKTRLGELCLKMF
ncbi:MAG: hypothetical protein MZV70_11495 [Desulfobacterales bacterium]|nr:hypothetical protein [Desulfobacterales bacterium]